MEFFDAPIAKAAASPQGARRAEVVIDVNAIGAGLDGLDDALRNILAEERLASAAPPKGDPLMLEVGQPRHFVRLAVQAAAQALFVSLRKPFVIAAELGDHSDAPKELQSARLFERLWRGLAAPSHGGGPVVLVCLAVGLGHENDIRSLQNRDLPSGCKSREEEERQTRGFNPQPWPVETIDEHHGGQFAAAASRIKKRRLRGEPRVGNVVVLFRPKQVDHQRIKKSQTVLYPETQSHAL